MPQKLSILLLALFLAGCNARPTTPPTTPSVDQEEQAVYAFLLPKIYQHHSYVIMEMTATSATGVDNTAQTLGYVLQNMHDVDQETVDSFSARNDRSYVIPGNMQLGSPYIIMSQAEKNTLFGQNRSGWELFYNRYPTAPGITTLSRVGFNKAFDQALVYIGTQSNWLAGEGYYILLKKAGGAWNIDQQVQVWIS